MIEHWQPLLFMYSDWDRFVLISSYISLARTDALNKRYEIDKIFKIRG